MPLAKSLRQCANLKAFQCSPIPVRKAFRSVTCKVSNEKSNISEDVLARLKQAEEEAARLRKELAAVQASQASKSDLIESRPKRIDGTDNRETLVFLNESKRSSWLSESDVDFFTGGGPGESQSQEDTPSSEPDNVVKRRLLIAGLISAGLIAFALVPTEQLRFRPSKPLYLFIIPLLRIQDLLAESRALVEDAEWDQLRVLLSRVKGVPNRARENLDNCIAFIEKPSSATAASNYASEFMGYLENMDYNKYFDSMPGRVLTGAQNAEFVKFSSSALSAAENRLRAFLSLLPSEAVTTARNEIQSQMGEVE